MASLAAPPIFVVGAHRSGTTWVFDALTAHPQVAGVFESHLFTRRGFAGLLVDDAWRDGLQEGHRELTGHGTGVGQLVDRGTVLAAVRDLSTRWLAEAIGDGDRFLVEKTPTHYNAIRLIAELFPSARFVHVLRDGRDVALSIRSAGSSWAPGWRNASYGPPWLAARAWSAAVSTARRQLASISNPSLEIRFEELLRDPVRGLRRLFEFCEIPADEAALSDIALRTRISRQPRTGEGSFRRRGREGDWREAFGPLDRFVFRLAAGDALAETGYAQPPGPALRYAQRLLQRARAKRDATVGRSEFRE